MSNSLSVHEENNELTVIGSEGKLYIEEDDVNLEISDHGCVLDVDLEQVYLRIKSFL